MLRRFYRIGGLGIVVVAFLTLMGCATAVKTTLLEETGSQPSGNLDNALSDLTTQIVSSMTEGGKRKVAVIEFSDLEGEVTQFGKYLAEELITRLFFTKKFEVIERQLLNKVLSEQELSLTGVIDPNSAKELGRILGVDAIVSGTITDLGESLKVNARIISTETGRISGVAAVEIVKDETVRKLMGRVSVAQKPVIPKPTEKVTEEKASKFLSAVEINAQKQIRLDYLLHELKSSKRDVEDKKYYLIIKDIGVHGDWAYVFENGRIVLARTEVLTSLKDVDDFKNSLEIVFRSIAKVMADFNIDDTDDLWLHNFKIYSQEENIYKRLVLTTDVSHNKSYIIEIPVVKLNYYRLKAVGLWGSHRKLLSAES